jgi:hypothetical protein
LDCVSIAEIHQTAIFDLAFCNPKGRILKHRFHHFQAFAIRKATQISCKMKVLLFLDIELFALSTVGTKMELAAHASGCGIPIKQH